MCAAKFSFGRFELEHCTMTGIPNIPLVTKEDGCAAEPG